MLFAGNGTGQPTPAFFQVAETNRQSLNLGPALVRLKSSQVAMKMGRYFYGGRAVYNELPVGVRAWDATQDPYMVDLTATNVGSLNDGLEGDVLVGWFQPLDPSWAELGHGSDRYFMVVNGLSDPAGTAAATKQRIRLDFDFGNSGIDGLLRLSRANGQVERVDLVADGGARYHLDLYLDGGTGDLFKFDDGGSFILPLPVPLPGDVNGDRQVDYGDLALLAPFYGTGGGRTWQQGDFDGNGFVNLADIHLMAAQFGRTPTSGPLGVSSAQLLGTLGSMIPEPSTATLLVAVLLSAPRRRRA